MSNMEPARLARLRPEKLDDNSVKKQILLIQKACGNVSVEKIALVFHECDYNMQQTISRIRAGDFDDGGWQTAKSNNKKKIQHTTDQKTNGSTISDSERSLSQRTSPTPCLRGGHYRNDYQYQYPSSGRANSGRRGHHSGRNSRYPPRNNAMNKPISTNSSQAIQDEPLKQSNEEIPQRISPSIDEYEFIDGIPQSLSFDNSQLKTSLQTLSKRRTPSSIPQQPVSMHRSVQLPTEPIDIQFGDVQWNDSIPIAVSPSKSLDIPTELNHHDNEIPSISDTQNQDVQDSLSSNYMNHQATSEIDNPLHETTNQLSTLSIADNTISNSLPVVPAEGTSHLSDHLTDTLSPMSAQYSSQQQVPIQIPLNRLPPTSTPRAPDSSSTPTQFMMNNIQQANNGINSSAFTPFNALVNYQSLPREYSQTPTNWNTQSANYKTTPKGTIIQTGTYPQQQTYQQLPTQQQQIVFGAYPYGPLSPAVVPVFTSFDQWPAAAFQTPIEAYQYPTTNYISPYPNQPTYHLPQTKYDQSYDKEYYAQYGQTRPLNNDISYQQPQAQQQPSTLSQPPTKETHLTSKLSPNAASFCQGAPLTVAPSTAPTTVYLNPVGFHMPNYYPSVAGSIQPDRISSYSSLDNRDNRYGASYSNNTNRNNYYHHGQQQQQQRTHNNNGSNSAWHQQQ